MSVITALLNGDIEEDIYMQDTAVFRYLLKSRQVRKLHKSLYELKQAPREWYSKIKSFLFDTLNDKICP